MMGERTVLQESLFYSFNLDRHVPMDHLLRSVTASSTSPAPRTAGCPTCHASEGGVAEDQYRPGSPCTGGERNLGGSLSRETKVKASVLPAIRIRLSVEDVADPVIGTGEVLVDVVAAPVRSYTDKVLSGARRHLLPTPVAPGGGAVGRVRAVGPDAARLQPGDWVFCDPTVRSRGGGTPDITLQRVSARGEGGQKLQHYFRDGPFAEQVRVPTKNAVPIGAIDCADAVTDFGQARAGRWMFGTGSTPVSVATGKPTPAPRNSFLRAG